MNNKPVREEYKKLREELSRLDTQRGNSADGLKGFYFEYANATENNVEKIEKGIAAREEVINNNGPADAVIKYKNGSVGRKKQYKSGYNYSQHKKNIESGKYDNQIYSINKDNPVLSNPEKFEALKSIAKERNIKIEVSKVSDREVKSVAKVAQIEGKIRNGVGLDQTAPITSYVYSTSKELMHLTKNAHSVAEAGLKAVRNAEGELVIIAVENLVAIVNEEKDFSDAIVDTAGTVAGIAATGALDELFFGGNGVVPEVVAVACVMKDSFMKYLNDEINGEEFVQEIAQKGVPLLAGKLVGIATGGNIVAQMLATYACALIYNEIQTLIRDYKSINTMQQGYIARLNRVSKQMIEELQIQQENFKEAFGEDYLKWNQAIDSGFELITYGNQNMDMQSVSRGIDSILQLFGGEVTFKDKNDVRDFLNLQDRVLKL